MPAPTNESIRRYWPEHPYYDPPLARFMAGFRSAVSPPFGPDSEWNVINHLHFQEITPETIIRELHRSSKKSNQLLRDFGELSSVMDSSTVEASQRDHARLVAVAVYDYLHQIFSQVPAGLFYQHDTAQWFFPFTHYVTRCMYQEEFTSDFPDLLLPYAQYQEELLIRNLFEKQGTEQLYAWKSLAFRLRDVDHTRRAEIGDSLLKTLTTNRETMLSEILRIPDTRVRDWLIESLIMPDATQEEIVKVRKIWRNSHQKSSLATVVERHTDAAVRLYSERPGAPTILRRQFNLHNLAHYADSALLRQIDTPITPCQTLVISGAWSHNAAGYQMRTAYEQLAHALPADWPLVFIEISDISQLPTIPYIRQVMELGAYPRSIIQWAHSDPNSMWYGPGWETGFSRSHLRLNGELKNFLRELFSDCRQMVMIGCNTVNFSWGSEPVAMDLARLIPGTLIASETEMHAPYRLIPRPGGNGDLWIDIQPDDPDNPEHQNNPTILKKIRNGHVSAYHFPRR